MSAKNVIHLDHLLHFSHHLYFNHLTSHHLDLLHHHLTNLNHPLHLIQCLLTLLTLLFLLHHIQHLTNPNQPPYILHHFIQNLILLTLLLHIQYLPHYHHPIYFIQYLTILQPSESEANRWIDTTQPVEWSHQVPSLSDYPMDIASHRPLTPFSPPREVAHKQGLTYIPPFSRPPPPGNHVLTPFS